MAALVNSLAMPEAPIDRITLRLSPEFGKVIRDLTDEKRRKLNDQLVVLLELGYEAETGKKFIPKKKPKSA